MARLEKRRMTESATHPSNAARPSSSLLINGLPTSHSNNNEIENLLFKHDPDPSQQQFSVSIPENILLNNQIAHYTSPPSSKRARASNEHSIVGSTMNGPLSPNKKSRLTLSDETKISPGGSHSATVKSSKKNRNKQQQQANQPQTILKTAATGIFPQQTVPLQHAEETSDDVNHLSFIDLIENSFCFSFRKFYK